MATEYTFKPRPEAYNLYRGDDYLGTFPSREEAMRAAERDRIAHTPGPSARLRDALCQAADEVHGEVDIREQLHIS